MRQLIGKIHSCSISQQSQLTGNFNRHLEQALFVQVEEAIWAGNRQAENVLNELITSDTIYIERKGIDAVPVHSVMRLLITSNNDWVIPAGTNERRHAVFEVGDEHAKDRPYFGAIQTELENGGYERLMHELETREFKNADPCVAPDTDALLEQKSMQIAAKTQRLYSGFTRYDVCGENGIWRKHYWQYTSVPVIDHGLVRYILHYAEEISHPCCCISHDPATPLTSAVHDKCWWFVDTETLCLRMWTGCFLRDGCAGIWKPLKTKESATP